MPMAGRFCVIASARSGSNHFGSLLGRHRAVWVHGEIFHQHGMFPALRKHVDGQTVEIEDPGHSLEERNADPFGYLDALMARTERDYVTGFKIFPNHNDDVVAAMIDDEAVKKIVLIRMNALAQYSSDLEAAARDRYVFLEGDETPQDVAIRFDREEFERRQRHIAGWYARWIARLNERGQGYFLIPYEFMASTAYLQSAFVFLGLDPVPAETLRSRFRKSGNRNVVDRFANRDAVAAYLEETGQEHLAHDVPFTFA